MYVNVTVDPLVEVNRVPTAARRLDTGEWVLGLRNAAVDVQEATGWHEVVEVARPADTDTHTHDRTVKLVNGDPTVVWTRRPRTAEELANRERLDNRTAIEVAIDAAIAQLDALIAAPAVAEVPAGTMTTAQLSAVARATRDAVQQNRAGAQQVALTLKRTIKLLRGDYDSVD